MDWKVAIVIVAVIAAYLLIKRMSLIPADTARQHLASGALVIDVRSQEEFRNGNISGAVNIPLGDLRDRMPEQVKDKGKVLLLHCLSGGRSGIAQQQLKGMGYLNVFNLGSLSRAREIVNSARDN